MSILTHIADRVLNRPLLITPEKAQVVISILGNRLGVNAPSADRFEGDHFQRDQDGRVDYATMSPYPVTHEGTAVLSIVGSLVNRGAYVGASSGVVSYEGIKHQLKHAAGNPTVRNVILDLQSPGGEAVGAFEAAEQVRLLAVVKPVTAIVNGMAASAAYAIASGATEIVTTETGVNGSIGVVLLHADFSKQLAEDGINPTLIFAGAHKVDGNPFEPLSEAVRADLQAEVNAFYDQFLATVAKGRGERMTVDMARGTEARTFIGAEAVRVGLADRLGSFETVLAELSNSSSAHAGRTNSLKGTTMSEQSGAPAAETTGISQADHDAAVTSARNAGAVEGAQTERARFQAIAGQCDAANLAAALDLAIKSPDMSAEDVTAFVSAHVKPDAGAKATDYLDHKARGNGTTNLQTDPPNLENKVSGLAASVDRYIARQAGR